jgi:hypothetical protein
MELTHAEKVIYKDKVGMNEWIKAGVEDGNDSYESVIYTQDGLSIYIWSTDPNKRTLKEKRNEIRKYLSKIVHEQVSAVRSKNERVKREI